MDTYIEAYQEAWSRTGDFNGRSSRREFFSFYFGNFFLMILFGLIDFYIINSLIGLNILPLTICFQFLTILPAFSVLIRRLHDTGRSGYMVLLSIIPIIGNLIVFFFLISEGDKVRNQYGTVPNL